MTNIRNALMQAAGSASGDKVYVEDVFSTTLYVGNGSGTLNTITTGLDLADKGGAVWIKGRDMGTGNHALYDSERGDASSNHSYKWLVPNENYEENNGSANLFQLHSLTSTGFKVQYTNTLNESGRNFVSWNFAKQEGFFDVVTYTGTGSGQAIAHNLGCKPGMILVKLTSASGYSWGVWHKSLAINYALALDTSAAVSDDYGGGGWWNSTAPTATHFSVGTYGIPNASGEDFVAYLFADGDESAAQIFGDDGDESIVATGTYTGSASASGPLINLGWEPQMVIIKASTYAESWGIYDNMRGVSESTAAQLHPNSNTAEYNQDVVKFNSRGFQPLGTAGNTNHSVDYIYIAIRRGPMKEPSAGTDVYNYQTRGGGGSGPPAYIFPHPVDWFLQRELGGTDDWYTSSRLIQGKYLKADETDATTNSTFRGIFDFQNGFADGAGTASSQIAYAWRRYPKVFDVVVYEGNGSNSPFRTITHNLGVAAELVIIKNIDQALHWGVNQNTGNSDVDADEVYLNLDGVYSNSSGLTASATTVTLNAGWGGTGQINNNGDTHLMLMFASLSGISKVGTYTGTGSAINVDCGFSGGARWVMVKRTDASADWYIVSSGRGFGKHLKVDSDADESSTAVLDTLSAGFTVRSDAGNDLNANGGTYLYLAFS